ncbi:MAG: efflux RND transporter permease subunit, partial [Bacteroidetes bacterium]|nr:efflux RND transporter permease subunit [Bacteroidota bacterium]
MNKLPKFAINNFQFVIIIFAVLLLWGLRAFNSMPRTEDPPAGQPGAIVTVVYPGANPSDMEELVINKIEEKVNELEDIQDIKSIAADGFALVNVTFNYGKYDFDDKYDDVVQQVNAVKTDLPDGIREINYRKKTTTDTKILQLALSSETVEYIKMKNTAEILEQKLEQVEGIMVVDIIAAPDKQVKIEINSDKMVNMGINIDNISNAINANNQNIPGGEVIMGENSFNVKTSGSYNSLDEIKNTVVGSAQGQLVYLKDVADVNLDYEYNKYQANFNGKRSIFITAEQKMGTNVLEIAENAHIVIDEFKEDLPAGMELNYVHDQSVSVSSSVNGFLMNLLQGIMLVGLVIMFAIGFKSSIIIMVAIPSSILIGLGFVDMAGFGLQNVSIAALVIALGLLVDNSIVVIENAERLLQKGYSSKKAAIEGTKQVAYPIITSTLTTLAAFIPIAMMPDAAGDYIKSLPVTVIATLSVSVILALTVSPLLMSKFVKPEKDGKPKEKKLQKVLKGFIQGPYKKALHYSLTHTRTVIIIAVLVFASSLVVLKLFVGSSFFPKAEKPMFMVQATLPKGKSLEETKKAAAFIESVLDTTSSVKQYAGNIGNGNPKVYFNTFPKENAKNFTEYYVVLNEYEAEEFNALVQSLRNTFDQYIAADIKVKEFQQGQPIQYPVEVVLMGDNVENLVKVSEDIRTILQNQEGVINVNNELEGMRTDLHVNINKDKASLMGVPVSTIDKTIRTALNGLTISQFRTSEGDEYDMILSLPIDNKAKIEDFDKIFLKSMSGEQIPLSQLARIEFATSPS